MWKESLGAQMGNGWLPPVMTEQIYATDIRLLPNLGRHRVTRDLTPDECKRAFESEKCPPQP